MSFDDDDDDDEFAAVASAATNAVVVDKNIAGLSPSTILERTISYMTPQGGGICADVHGHSWTPVNFGLSLTQTCGICAQRLPTWTATLLSSTTSNIVKCLACAIPAHRNCAMSRTNSAVVPMCAANTAKMRHVLTTEPQQLDNLRQTSSGSLVAVEEQSGETRNNSTEEDPTNTSNFDDDVVNVSQSSLRSVPPLTHVPLTNANNAAKPNDNNDNPLELAHQTFANVSRAIQEHVLTHFSKMTSSSQHSHSYELIRTDSGDDGSSLGDGGSGRSDDDENAIENNISAQHKDTEQYTARLSERREPQRPPHSNNSNVVSGLASNAAHVLSGSAKIGAYVVAGTLVGGVGIASVSAAAGVLGVLMEGGIGTAGVVVTVVGGVGVAKHVQHQQQQQQRHVLAMGEAGIQRKLLLVRPNVHIDPEWATIAARARQSAPSPSSNNAGGIPLLSSLTSLMMDGSNNSDSRRHDSDIIASAEDELPIQEKVFLLTSRVLNDKTSMAGHVYRCLLDSFRERCVRRALPPPLAVSCSMATEPDAVDQTVWLVHRARRDDVHAVIKHVSAVLLETRPGLESSPALTEWTAVAVENLVFGQVYDLVYQEVQRETAERDSDLLDKIAVLEAQGALISDQLEPLISTAALAALRQMPGSHSAVGKLECGVHFLEHISAHLQGQVCADSLLQLVCQHVLVAQVPHINAEVAWVDEFARDEHLLRGKAGYALVTLQAALHFLHATDDVMDILANEEGDDDNAA